jgi:ribosomal protein L40E
MSIDFLIPRIMKTKQCKKCNAELNYRAVKCDKCSTTQHPVFWMDRRFHAMAAVAAFGVFAVAVGTNMSKTRKEQQAARDLGVELQRMAVEDIKFAKEVVEKHERAAESIEKLEREIAAAREPKLELQSWSWKSEYGYAVASGQVKNISGKVLENVEALVTFYAADGTFISSDSALIEYQTLMPEQTSPFSVAESLNPRMSKARVEFKEFFGSQIPHKKKGE